MVYNILFLHAIIYFISINRYANYHVGKLIYYFMYVLYK